MLSYLVRTVFRIRDSVFRFFKRLFTNPSLNNYQAWFVFSRVNILAEIKRHLTSGSPSGVQVAVLLWVRHQADFLATLDLSGVEQLLACSSCGGLDLDQQLRWLRQFVPDTLAVLPTALPVIATWALQAVTQLELQRGRNRAAHNCCWPDNGLRFAEEMLAAMQFGRDGGGGGGGGGGGTAFNQFLTILTLSQQRAEVESPLSHLVRLIVDLGHLVKLYRSYRIRPVHPPPPTSWKRNSCQDQGGIATIRDKRT